MIKFASKFRLIEWSIKNSDRNSFTPNHDVEAVAMSRMGSTLRMKGAEADLFIKCSKDVKSHDNPNEVDAVFFSEGEEEADERAKELENALGRARRAEQNGDGMRSVIRQREKDWLATKDELAATKLRLLRVDQLEQQVKYLQDELCSMAKLVVKKLEEEKDRS